jgi:processive 1,2-diacylglycerol beta-glucosyltransferase
MTAHATPPPRVLVLTLSFGSGHVRAAAAIADELRRQSPEANVEVVDVLQSASLLFRAIYVWPYWAMLRLAPWAWRRLFASRLRREVRHTAPPALFRLGCRATFARVRDGQPDVIVAAEVAACEIAVAARRAGMTGAAVVAVLTDAQAEPAWVAPEVLRYAVPSESVAGQLAAWGARPPAVMSPGIPISSAFSSAVAGGPAVDDRTTQRVLLMGGGMGPTRMDRVAAALLATGRTLEVIALTGRDTAARRRLERLRHQDSTRLRILGWTDDVAELMRTAAVLVTKPGGLTIAEAAASGLPAVLFDPIPGPEEANAMAAVAAGAAVLARGSQATAAATLDLLDDPARLARMSAAARATSRPAAAAAVAQTALEVARGSRPIVLLTIRNGAGHTRAAEAIAESLAPARAEVLDVADYFTLAARFTHVTAYLWLVRRAPSLWDAIDRAQKRRSSTSPDWFYRRGARRLKLAIESLDPSAIAATEVGCCEIAALVKRDLRLDCPLVAVDAEYDADRAWVRPEVTEYAVSSEAVAAAFVAHGANPSRIRVTGVPLHAEFGNQPSGTRGRLLRSLDLDPGSPVVLVAGGSEGLGAPDRVAESLLARIAGAQVLLLAGRNGGLKRSAEARLARYRSRVRILGWTPHVGDLMASADLLVSKLGHTFDEAIASRLPIVALPPPPGAERIQYNLLRTWSVGCQARDVNDAVETVEKLLRNPAALEALRSAAARRARPAAASRIAQSLTTALDPPPAAAANRPRMRAAAATSEAGA